MTDSEVRCPFTVWVTSPALTKMQCRWSEGHIGPHAFLWILQPPADVSLSVPFEGNQP